MARLNIEDSIFRDPRYQDFIIAMGDSDKALGAIIKAWMAAQKFWLPSKGMGIPKATWDSLRLSPFLITSGLAEDLGDYVYVRGSRDQFKWLNQRSDAGKKKGPNKDRPKKSRLDIIKESTQRNATERNGTQPLSLSPSLSLSPALSPTLKNSPSGGADAVASPIAYFVGSYVKAFQGRYGDGARPDLSGRRQGEIKAFLKGIPVERAITLINHYLSMDDKWFITKCHDFTTFTHNLDKIGVALDTGLAPGDAASDWLRQQMKLDQQEERKYDQARVLGSDPTAN